MIIESHFINILLSLSLFLSLSRSLALSLSLSLSHALSFSRSLSRSLARSRALSLARARNLSRLERHLGHGCCSNAGLEQRVTETVVTEGWGQQITSDPHLVAVLSIIFS